MIRWMGSDEDDLVRCHVCRSLRCGLVVTGDNANILQWPLNYRDKGFHQLRHPLTDHGSVWSSCGDGWRLPLLSYLTLAVSYYQRMAHLHLFMTTLTTTKCAFAVGFYFYSSKGQLWYLRFPLLFDRVTLQKINNITMWLLERSGEGVMTCVCYGWTTKESF